MKKEMSAFALVLAAVLLFVYLFNLSPTGFVVQSGTSNFASTPSNNFVNTTYNNSAITLAGNATAGYYLSDIFGNGTNYLWNNMTWVGNTSSNSSLSFQATTCSDANCSGATFSSVNLSNLNLTGEYFQYKVLFSRNNVNVTSPSLTSVSYAYSSIQNATNKGPTLNIISPTNTTYSNVTQLVNISAEGADSIWYDSNGTNVTYNGSGYVTFPDGANTLTAYANDTNGTIASKSVSFTIHIPTCSDDPSLCTESECDNIYSSDNWYNGTCHDSPQSTQQQQTQQNTTQQANATQQQQNTTLIPPQVTKLTASSISETNLTQGGSENLTLSVQNSGTTSLSGCALKVSGNYASWFTIIDKNSKSLNPGEKADFAFSANAPLSATVGPYLSTASVDCAQTSASQDFKIDVQQKKLNISIISTTRNKLDNVQVSYSLSDLTGHDQNVSVTFDITDMNNTQIGNASDTDQLSANATKDFSLNIPINSSAEGNMSLSGTFNSETFSSTVLEPILLGAPVSGLVIGSLGTGSVVVVLVVVVVFLALFFGVKRFRKKAKKKSSSSEERRSSESEH